MNRRSQYANVRSTIDVVNANAVTVVRAVVAGDCCATISDINNLARDNDLLKISHGQYSRSFTVSL